MKFWQRIELIGKALTIFPILILVFLIQPNENSEKNAQFALLMSNHVVPGSIEYRVRTMHRDSKYSDMEYNTEDVEYLDKCVLRYGKNVSLAETQELIISGMLDKLDKDDELNTLRLVCRMQLILEAVEDLNKPIWVFNLLLLIVSVFGGILLIYARYMEIKNL